MICLNSKVLVLIYRMRYGIHSALSCARSLCRLKTGCVKRLSFFTQNMNRFEALKGVDNGSFILGKSVSFLGGKFVS